MCISIFELSIANKGVQAVVLYIVVSVIVMLLRTRYPLKTTKCFYFRCMDSKFDVLTSKLLLIETKVVFGNQHSGLKFLYL